MKSGRPLKRGKRLKARKVPKAFQHRRDPAYCDWIRQRGCIVRGKVGPNGREHVCQGAVQVCHVKSRGSGGDDHANVVSMCWRAHFQQGLMGIASFSNHWNVDLRAHAVRLWKLYQQGGGTL